MIPPSQHPRTSEPIISANASQPRRVHARRRPAEPSTSSVSTTDMISGTKPDQHQPLRGASGPCSSATALDSDDEQQEGEDPRLDRERAGADHVPTRKRAERDLLVAEHAGDADHAAVEDREKEERAR